METEYPKRMKITESTHKQITLQSLLLLCAFLFISVASNAQRVNVNLPEGVLSARKVIELIETQTSYVVAYDNNIFDSTITATYNTGEITITEAMNKLLDGKGYDFIIRGNFILINKRQKKTIQQPKLDQQSYSTGDVYVKGQPSDASTIPNPHKKQDSVDTGITAVTIPETTEPIPYSSYNSLDKYVRLESSYPKYAVKINALYGLATLTPNIGFEIGLNGKSSLDFSASFNPWNREGTPDDNKKIAHALIRTEYRRWLCEQYNGHFFGVHAYYTNFNVSGHKVPLLNFKKENRYQGFGFGAGITYGYNLPLSKNWGLEFNIGIGAAWLKTDKYDCGICSEVKDTYDKIYVGPTRAGITLVYIIK